MNKWQNAIYLSGGLLMVVGAGCYCFLLWQQVMTRQTPPMKTS